MDNISERSEDAQQGLKEESAPGSQPTQVDYAAQAYQKLLPMFYDSIEELSNRQLKKVIGAIMEYPLNKSLDDFRWSYDKEKKSFDLANKIMDCRFVIIKAILDMSKEQIKEALEETKAQQKGTEVKLEETN